MSQHVDIKVRCTSAGYQTSACGQRASCTAGAGQAAERLGEKIFGRRFIGVTKLPAQNGDDHNVTRWRLAGKEA